MANFKVKSISLFIVLCFGLTFSLQAQEQGVLVAKGGTFSDFVVDGKLISLLRKAEGNREEMPEIYSVLLSDSIKTSKQVSSAWVRGSAIPFLGKFQNQAQVIYQTYINNKGVSELFMLATDMSSMPIKISEGLESGQSVQVFSLSKDKTRLVYLTSNSTLYAVSLDDFGITQKISKEAQNVQTFDISNDGTKIVYVAESGGTHELYVSSGERTAIKLNDELVKNGNVTGDFYLTKDNKSVIYRADQDRNNIFELYRVPLDASSKAIKISSKIGNNSVGAGFRLTNNEKRVIYRARSYAHRSFQLYSALLDASSNSVNQLSEGNVKKFRLNHSANTVIYLASERASNQFDVYTIGLDGKNGKRKINSDLVDGGTVKSFRLGANGDRIVYRANQETKNIFELYTASLSDSTSLKKVSLNLEGSKRIRGFVLAKSGTKLIYVADYEQDKVFELYATTFDSVAQTVKLNGKLLEGESVGKFRLTRDETQVIYQAKQNKKNIFTETEESEAASALASGRAEKSENDEGLASSKANIYPNPATNTLFVRFPKLDKATYSILDEQGKLILEGQLRKGRARINLQKFAKGAYQLRINDGLKTITKKFIKN